MVACDNTLLSLLLQPDSAPPTDSEGQPIARARERADYLVKTLEMRGETILIPTPVLSEFLVLAAEDGPKYLEIINGSAHFRVADFDQKAAVEAAALTIQAMQKGGKRGGSAGTWAKVKYDRQIVAIAKVAGAEVIYSDDRDVATFAEEAGVTCTKTVDLPLPPPETGILPFDDPPIA